MSNSKKDGAITLAKGADVSIPHTAFFKIRKKTGRRWVFILFFFGIILTPLGLLLFASGGHSNTENLTTWACLFAGATALLLSQLLLEFFVGDV